MPMTGAWATDGTELERHAGERSWLPASGGGKARPRAWGERLLKNAGAVAMAQGLSKRVGNTWASMAGGNSPRVGLARFQAQRLRRG